MKRFLLKIVILGLPFGILWLVTFLKYETNKGDLIRIGYIYNSFPEYRSKFELNREILFDRVSDLPTDREYDVLTIGDSFSELGATGYQNYLAAIHGKKVLHLDNSYHSNAFQALISLNNSGFFEEFKIKNVILEVVERHFVENSFQLNTDSVLNYSELKKHNNINLEFETETPVSNRILKFPYYSIKRFFHHDDLISKIYVRELKSKRFLDADNRLYFYYLDIENIYLNNSLGNLESLNKTLNNLNKSLENKFVNLILLPAPDKFHFYKNDLVGPSEFQGSLFFDNFSKIEKEYASLNLMDEILKNQVDIMDFYYYDDSHWSPIGNKYVAERLVELMDD